MKLNIGYGINKDTKIKDALAVARHDLRFKYDLSKYDELEQPIQIIDECVQLLEHGFDPGTTLGETAFLYDSSDNASAIS